MGLMCYSCVELISFEVSVAIETRAIVRQELATLLGCDNTGLHGCGSPCLNATHQLLGRELYIVEHLGNGLTIDDLVYLVTVFIYTDVNGVGVAKEVVQVAQYLLVSTYKEHTDVVGFFAYCVNGE